MHTDGSHLHTRSRQGSLSSDLENQQSKEADPSAPFALSKPAHLLSPAQVVRELTTDPDNGLTQDQVTFRLQNVGLNELIGDGGVSIFRIFMGQLLNAMSLVLIMGMVASFAIKSWIEASVVTAVVVVNIVVGFFQEYSAEKTMGSLRSLSSPTAQVIRDGNIVTVRSADVAPGDIVEVKTGDTIPADMRIFECMNFEVDEALLTGESLPISKSSSIVFDPSHIGDVGVGDRLNMAYSSSTVTKGRAKGIVVYTGMSTEIGKIALSLHSNGKRIKPKLTGRSAENPDAPSITTAHKFRYYLSLTWSTIKHYVGQFLGVTVGTPLQRKLSWLAILLFGIAVVFAVICLAANGFRNEQAVILYAVGTGLSMIPASLVVVLTITMAVGTKIMVSRNVIVRKLDSLEALGAVTNICSDKTGTLTQGKMVVRKAWVASCDSTYEVGESSAPLSPTGALIRLEKGSPKDLLKIPKTRVQREVENPWRWPDVFVKSSTTSSSPGMSLSPTRTWTLTDDAAIPIQYQQGVGTSSARESVDHLQLSRSNINLTAINTSTKGGPSSPYPDPSTPFYLQHFLNIATFCNTAIVAESKDEPGKWHTRGDPTEVAIQVFTSRFDWNRRKFTHGGVLHEDEQQHEEHVRVMGGAGDEGDGHGPTPTWKLLAEYPFDSDVKRMSVIYAELSSSSTSTESSSTPSSIAVDTPPTATTVVTTWAFMKGAVERVLDACTSIHVDGHVVDFNPAWRDHVLQNMEVLASQGLRVLAMASKEVKPPFSSSAGVATSSSSALTLNAFTPPPPDAVDDWSGYPRSEVEKDMTFHGLVGLYDPPRPETAGAVKNCHRAGINVHMLTGDHPETAKAIAAEVGIIPRTLETLAPTVKSAMVMTASQFDKLSDAQIDSLPVLPLVIARCAPSTKVRMVDALHRRKKFVAMTGDGVNDSPALKRADVGIGMGLAGSDVAKDASDIVLTDDNFASILNAIEEGRRTFDNIKKFVLHLLAENIAQACTLLIGLAFKDRTGLSVFPLAPVEILWIIMITSGFPAMGLGMEVASDDIMIRPPHNVKVGIFTTEILLDMIVYGFYMALLCLTSFSLVVFAFGNGELGLGCNDHYHPSCELVFRARSTTFTCLTWFALILAWEMVHMRRSFFRMEGKPKRPWTMWMKHVWRNPFLFWSIMAGFITVFPIIYIPGLNRVVFKHGPISWEWGIVFVESGMFIGGIELWKWGKRVWERRYGEKVRDPQSELGRRMMERYASLATSGTQTVGGGVDEDGDDDDVEEKKEIGNVNGNVNGNVGVRDLEAQR